MTLKGFFLLFFSLFLCQYINSQIYEKNIQWKSNLKENIEGNKFELLHFHNSFYQNLSTGLPYYYEVIALSGSNNEAKIEIISANYEPVPQELLSNAFGTDSIKPEINFHYYIGYERKKPSLNINFIPLRRNQNTGKIERLVQFVYRVTEKYNPLKSVKSRVYADNSVLSSGKWVKIKVNKTGIYKITYSQIVDYGFQNPENIKLYGNGGKVLPIYNSVLRYDDLVQNPLFYDKGQDGVFNSGDYILFYAHSPVYWSYNTSRDMFLHSLHPFTDESFYFLTDEGGPPMETETLGAVTSAVNQTVTSFDDYGYHENESVNFLKSGKLWVGENYNIILSYDYPFYFNNITPNSEVKLLANLFARSSVSSTFTVNLNGQQLGNAQVNYTQLTSPTSFFANETTFVRTATTSSNSLSVSITYNKPVQGGEGWLNYIDINVRRNLAMSGGLLQFRDLNSVIAGGVSEFIISGTNSNTLVWDVTNPVRPLQVPVTFNGNSLSFVANTDTLREFIAFDRTMFYTPTVAGEIANQDLHSIQQADLVIISHPNFLTEAQALAEHHRSFDNLTVVTLTPDVIYNEFSSGSPDATAYKDFMKMLYDRAGTDIEAMPKYLLLWGDGSYDNRHNFSSNTNFVLTYQSKESQSLSPTNCFTTDDYFGMLHDSYGDHIGKLDIAVGRIPVKSASESRSMLNKILNYVSYTTYGDWKNILTFIGDDEDGNEHMRQANDMSNIIDTLYPVYNIDKIFLDAFPQITTPNGARYPDVNTAISNRIKKGSFIMNYIGHGNEIGLAHESILGVSDVNSWTNFEKLFLFITATCEFSRWDDYARLSAGEMSIMNPNGGAIAMFTTTRLVYSNSNFQINKAFYNHIFKRNDDGEYLRMGDIYRLAKNQAGADNDVNKRNFSLLGDPALTLSYPKYLVLTDSINGVTSDNNSDTIKALDKVTVKGRIAYYSGNTADNYNGTLYITIFDKSFNVTTLANDGGNTFTFSQQNNIIYKGKASVNNSFFEFTFVVPKDIRYNIGKWKISYYAKNNSLFDANGYDRNFYLGGTSSSSLADNKGPDIELYMNDENFVFGGITDENPYIYAILSDENGINTVGNGIGHDITSVVDDNTNKTMVMNDYYESDIDNYQRGAVRYPLTSLENGRHTLKLKAWDVCNNSSQSVTEFVVAKAEELTIGNVFNYPNPFTTSTDFYFDHNHPYSDLEIMIQIFTVTGKIVKTLKSNLQASGFHSSPIHWDGLDDFGDKIGKGVYLYKLSVKSQEDSKVQKYEKLVILR